MKRICTESSIIEFSSLAVRGILVIFGKFPLGAGKFLVDREAGPLNEYIFGRGD